MARRFTPRSSPFAPCELRQPTAVSSGNGFKAKSPVKQVKKQGIRTVVLGFVQKAGTSANDQSLSRQRARNVAAYLRGRGLSGSYGVRGDGVAGSGDAAWRVNVTVRCNPGC